MKNNNKIYFFFMPTLNNEEISKNLRTFIPEENKVSINKHLESKYFLIAIILK